MRIAIRNFRRVARADLELAPIALISGRNRQGKTSIFQAAQAALAAEPLPTGRKKKDAARLVARGSDAGSASAHHAAGEILVSWPSCDMESKGAAPRASAFAAGLKSLLDLPERERAAALSGYVASAPTVTDLADAMSRAGYADKAIDAIWRSTMAEGWDAIWRKTVEHGAKHKGQWEAVTGTKYGEKKAAAWTPEGWEPEIATADLDSLDAEIAEAQEAVDAALRQQGWSAAEADRLRALIAAAEKADLEVARQYVRATEEAVEAETAILRAMPEPSSDSGIRQHCPHCGAECALHIERPNDATRVYRLKIPEGHVDPAEMKRLRLDRQSQDLVVKNCEHTLERARAALAEAEAAHAKAAEARQQLENAGDSSSLDAARAALAAAQARRKMAGDKLEADRLHGLIERNAKLAALLSPDGLRKTALARGLADFNASLETLCAAAKWPAVRLDEDLCAWSGPEAYEDCSESEQWCVRLVIQVAMAMADGSDAVLLDRADMLDARHRNGLFAILKASGLKALVCMTMNKPELVPDLSRAGLGNSYWISDGVLGPIGADAEQKEAA